jgi:hypothetical protein
MSEIDREKLAKVLIKCAQEREMNLGSATSLANKIIEYYNEPEPSIQAALDLLYNTYAEENITKAIEILEQIPRNPVIDKHYKTLNDLNTKLKKDGGLSHTLTLQLSNAVDRLLEESCQT